MRVAFLGMGIMGRPMAANLVKAGHEVSIWNRSASPEKDIAGARTASTPSDAARGAEVVWMCVSDTKAVENVLFGPSGVEESLAEGIVSGHPDMPEFTFEPKEINSILAYLNSLKAKENGK